MGSKSLLFLLPYFLLLLHTKVLSETKEEHTEGCTTIAPTWSPTYKSSPPPPPVSKPPPAPPLAPPKNRQECTPLCVVRCKKHSRQNICMRACLTCCERCKCVPSGQYGNKEECGTCYTNMTTRGGIFKCP